MGDSVDDGDRNSARDLYEEASGAAGQRGRQPRGDSDSDCATPSSDSAVAAADTLPRRPAAPPAVGPAVPPSAEGATDTVRISTRLYTYGISSRGGRLIEARLPRYRSMAPSDSGRPAQLLPKDSRLLGLTLVLGRDTLPLHDWPFTISTGSSDAKAPTLRLSAARNGVNVDLTYTFRPDDYQIGVEGRVTGVGPNGGLYEWRWARR